MENRTLLIELCHILYKRNSIEARRRRAISKVAYYNNILKVCQAQKEYLALEREQKLAEKDISMFNNVRYARLLEMEKRFKERFEHLVKKTVCS